MDNSILQHERDARQPGRFATIVKNFKKVLNWLARLIQLTNEEQQAAGIYPGGTRDD